MSDSSEVSQKFIDEITSLLEMKDFMSAVNFFNDINHEMIVKNCSWDLIPVFCKYVTKEAKVSNNELAACCEQLLVKLAAKANPEEAVLEFLNQMDGADPEKFGVVLKLLGIVLSKEISNRKNSIEWTLNSIRSFTEQYSYNENSDDFDIEENEFFTNEKIIEIETVMNSVIAFYEPFVEEATHRPDMDDLKCLLSSRLLQMFDVFLPFVKIELFPQLQKIQWRITHLILQLLSNPMKLLEYVFYRALNIMKPKPKESPNKKFDLSNINDDDWSDDHLLDNPNPYEDETIVSNLAYGMFFYSLLSETSNEQIQLPLVYNPKYIMLSLIYVTVPFFDKKPDITVGNGLKFLKLLLTQLNDFLTKSDLYFSSHKALLIHLNNVMVFSQVEENRKLALTCFKKYIESFNWEGRYLLLFNFRSDVSHSGTLGFLISLLKEFVSTFLELPPNSPAHHKFLKYYRGKLLFDIIKKYCFLTNGSNTDLVESADHVISSLNALRYLVLRDKKNVTDVKNFIKKIHSDFLKPLQKNVISSRNYYNLKLQDLESNCSSLENSKSDVEVELAVEGQALPKLTKEQQIIAYHSCLNAVDLIDSLHARLMECINEAYSYNL